MKLVLYEGFTDAATISTVFPGVCVCVHVMLATVFGSKSVL